MLVFFEQRLVLLSVPKTGTTAYEAALAHHADMVVSHPPVLKHAPVYRYHRFFRPMFEKVCGVEMELMAVVRDPVSWLGSWYRYRHRPALAGHINSTQGQSFDDFVSAYLQGKRPSFADVGSQAKFLEGPAGGTTVRHLFRYEDQPGVRQFLTQRLGVPFEVERLNVSPQLPLDLSAAVERKLRRKCVADFELYDGIGGGTR